jgi:hypothetical protein
VFNVDSGTTLHLVKNKNLLSSRVPSKQLISTATNNLFVAKDKGPINTIQLKLKEVFAAPDLHENLLSVNQLDTDGYDTLFSKGNVFIGKDFQIPKKYAAKGSKIKGSYYLTLNKEITLANSFQALSLLDDNPTFTIKTPNASEEFKFAKPNSKDIAHRRLQHLHEAAIDELNDSGLLAAFNINLLVCKVKQENVQNSRSLTPIQLKSVIYYILI